MILDIIIILIFLITTIRGKVKGFADSLIRLASLAGGLILGVIFTEKLSAMIFATPVDESMRAHLTELFQGQQMDLTSFIPDVMREHLERLGLDALNTTVNHFTNLAITILSFLIIVVGVSVIATLIRKKLKKDRKKKNLIGTVDSSVGLLFGMIKGAILVLMFLAFMFPLAGIFMPQQIPAINEQLNNSYVAGYLYDINPLIYFMHNLPL